MAVPYLRDILRLSTGGQRYVHQQAQVLATTQVPVTVQPGGTVFVRAAAASGLTVEIVNDSQTGNQTQRSDSSVFVLLTGTELDISGSIANVTLPQNQNSSVNASALSSLGAPVNTTISRYTGNPLNIYGPLRAAVRCFSPTWFRSTARLRGM